MDTYGHWNIDAVGTFNSDDWFGCIYEIEQLSTGRKYLGKKVFKFKRQKTKANKSRTKESDWKSYTSSSDLLNEYIAEEGHDAFAFRILRLCSGKCELTYTEQEVQFAADVLRARLPSGERRFLNRTISHMNFSGIEKQSAETRRKMALLQHHAEFDRRPGPD